MPYRYHVLQLVWHNWLCLVRCNGMLENWSICGSLFIGHNYICLNVVYNCGCVCKHTVAYLGGHWAMAPLWLIFFIIFHCTLYGSNG